jgi:hypothetical protein
MDDGVAARMDRLKAIGNGQVPLCAATAWTMLKIDWNNMKKKYTDTDKITGQIVINLYEDSFEVKTTETVDLFTVWAVAIGIQEYLENIAEDLDKVDKIMLQ